MLVVTVLAFATALFASHRATLHTKVVALQQTQQQAPATALVAR
jgi:hypothetical protein